MRHALAEGGETGKVEVWRQYQEAVAAFFRTLGMQADTDVTLIGVRARHDADVLVRFMASGVTVTWIVECKQLNRPVSKSAVLTLESIVRDVGADRGLLVSESGFQAGAILASNQANITLTSLHELKDSTALDVERDRRVRQARGIAELSARSSRLWRWTIPQCQPPVLDMSDVLEVGGDVFELQQWMTPALLRASGHAAATNEEAVADRLAAVESSLSRLEAAAVSDWGRVATAAASLSAAVGGLLDEIAPVEGYVALTEEVGQRIVGAMQRISDEADRLRERTPEPVHRAVGVVMRRLLDSTYRLEEHHWPTMAAERTALADSLSAVAGAVEQVRPGGDIAPSTDGPVLARAQVPEEPSD